MTDVGDFSFHGCDDAKFASPQPPLSTGVGSADATTGATVEDATVEDDDCDDEDSMSVDEDETTTAPNTGAPSTNAAAASDSVGAAAAAKDRKRSLGAVAKALLGIELYKVKGGPSNDWSVETLLKMWVDYAVADVILPLLLFYHEQGRRGRDQRGSMTAARALIWESITEATSLAPWLDGKKPHNRHKRDWAHVYRSVLDLINKDHPARSAFAWFWAKHHMIQSLDSVRDEEDRLRKSGKSENEIREWHHTSTKGRVMQFVPRPEELVRGTFPRPLNDINLFHPCVLFVVTSALHFKHSTFC